VPYKELPVLRTHILVVRNDREFEWDEWMLPLLHIGLVINLPRVGKTVVDELTLDLTEEFPIQWAVGK
jgi:hypothetical protein